MKQVQALAEVATGALNLMFGFAQRMKMERGTTEMWCLFPQDSRAFQIRQSSSRKLGMLISFKCLINLYRIYTHEIAKFLLRFFGDFCNAVEFFHLTLLDGQASLASGYFS